MPLFATPDFGASGIVSCFVLLAWAVALLLAIAGFARGSRLVKRPARSSRISGVVLLLASVSLPLLCGFGPAVAYRLAYHTSPLGSYPNGKVHEGMTKDEVIVVLGPPARRENNRKGDGERWYYDIDTFGAYWFGVHFTEDGRVMGTYGN